MPRPASTHHSSDPYLGIRVGEIVSPDREVHLRAAGIRVLADGTLVATAGVRRVEEQIDVLAIPKGQWSCYYLADISDGIPVATKERDNSSIHRWSVLRGDEFEQNAWQTILGDSINIEADGSLVIKGNYGWLQNVELFVLAPGAWKTFCHCSRHGNLRPSRYEHWAGHPGNDDE